MREKEIQSKEAELEQVIKEYYRYDMSGLKVEINNMLERETKQVGEEKRVKLEEIKRKFAKLNALSADHVSRGSRHKAALGGSSEGGADEKLLGDFERYSEQYEEQVKAANAEK